MNILKEIVDNKRKEVALLKKTKSISDFEKMEGFHRPAHSLRDAISASDFGIIAEIKRKSPSGGEIQMDLQPDELALYYQQNGAAAISVLTDFTYFGGNINDVAIVRKAVDLPILRKEFIIDEIQLYEAKAFGADAVLLIASILSDDEIFKLTDISHRINLEVLFEIHDPLEIEKLTPHIDVIAVNNRNLENQQTSLEHSFNLASYLPKNKPLISASGIHSPEQIDALQKIGYNGGLIGESILRNRHLQILQKPVQ